jgi:hypothetical protein
MGALIKTLLIVLLFHINTNKTMAQIIQPKLNQVELMKQFIGTWKGEIGADTFLVSENNPFGTGIISNAWIITENICLDSIVQLFGYDNNADKFILAELIKSSPIIEVCNTWFTSNSTGETIIVNPENSNLRFRFEFKNPDEIVQTALLNEKIVSEICLKRIVRDKKYEKQ